MTGGSLDIVSEPGKGTAVTASFSLSHIDRMPLGDINSTMFTLIVFNEQIDFHYRYAYDEKEFTLDTKQMKELLGGMSFKEAEVSQFIREYLEDNKAEVDDGRTL